MFFLLVSWFIGMRSWLNPSFLADLSNIPLYKSTDEWSYFWGEKMFPYHTFNERNVNFDADGFQILNVSSHWNLVKVVKVESLIAMNDIEASHIDDDEKEMRQMGEAFDQHSKSPITSGLIHMNLAIYEWLVLIQNLFNYDDMKPMKSMVTRLYDEDIKYPVLKPLKCLIDDQAVRPDATEGVKVYEEMQKPALTFIPVHGRPPSLLGSIPSAIKDAEPLVAASRGTLIASTSWSSALLLVLMLVS